MKTRLIFTGAGLWDGGDVFPYDDTPIARVPVVGEFFVLSDDPEPWRVYRVTFDYSHGLNYEPVVEIVLARAAPSNQKESS